MLRNFRLTERVDDRTLWRAWRMLSRGAKNGARLAQSRATAGGSGELSSVAAAMRGYAKLFEELAEEAMGRNL